VFLDAMEPRISPNLKAHVSVFGSISRKEEGKAIVRKEVVSYEVTRTNVEPQVDYGDHPGS